MTSNIFDRIHNSFILSKKFPNAEWLPEYVTENIKQTSIYLENRSNYPELFENLGVGADYNKLTPKVPTEQRETKKFNFGKGLNFTPWEIAAIPTWVRLTSSLHKAIVNLTGFDLEHLSIPPIWKLTAIAKKINNGNLLLTNMCKLAYNMYAIYSLYNPTDKLIILEIGAGFGGLPYLFLNNMPNVSYVIVDIPTTSAISAFFLDKLGKNVCLHGEYNDLTPDTIHKYDCVIIPPIDIEKIKSKSIDVVINVDSLSEMSSITIKYYLKAIANICNGYFYSDNYMLSNANGRFIQPPEGFKEVYCGKQRLSIQGTYSKDLLIDLALGQGYKEMLCQC
jgi:hypothetical protein